MLPSDEGRVQTADPEEAEALNAFFLCVFMKKVSLASVLREQEHRQEVEGRDSAAQWSTC